MTYLQRQMHGHALISQYTQKAMLKMEREGITPDDQGNVGPITQIEELQKMAFHWLTLVMLLVQVLLVNLRQTQCFGSWVKISHSYQTNALAVFV